MRFPKEWKCMKCKENKDKTELIRISKSMYGLGRYDQFAKAFSIDLCEKCYEETLKEILENQLQPNPTYEDYY